MVLQGYNMSDETKNILMDYLDIIEKELNDIKNARDDYEPLEELGSEFTGS